MARALGSDVLLVLRRLLLLPQLRSHTLLLLGLHAAPVIRAELRGKDLSCWCAPDLPCHADVLLELANAGEPS